jgi:hypothetical protein
MEPALNKQNYFSSPESIARINLCRKFINREFGVRLDRHQQDLIPQIKHYAELSHSFSLKQLAHELDHKLSSHH